MSVSSLVYAVLGDVRMKMMGSRYEMEEGADKTVMEE